MVSNPVCQHFHSEFITRCARHLSSSSSSSLVSWPNLDARSLRTEQTPPAIWVEGWSGIRYLRQIVLADSDPSTGRCSPSCGLTLENIYIGAQQTYLGVNYELQNNN